MTQQICYLPTNTCKDQLSFPATVRTASDCENSTDCGKNEICYLPDKVSDRETLLNVIPLSNCVCRLGSVESCVCGYVNE